MTFTKSNVGEIQTNPAWKEMLVRLGKMMEVADSRVENPGEFNQGYFVGVRTVVSALEKLPETMLGELERNGAPQRMR